MLQAKQLEPFLTPRKAPVNSSIQSTSLPPITKTTLSPQKSKGRAKLQPLIRDGDIPDEMKLIETRSKDKARESGLTVVDKYLDNRIKEKIRAECLKKKTPTLRDESSHSSSTISDHKTPFRQTKVKIYSTEGKL